MKKSLMNKSLISVLGVAGAILVSCGLGCARPGELGYTPAYTATERYHLIARNWDNEGKMSQDDIDSILLLRPESTLSPWNIR